MSDRDPERPASQFGRYRLHGKLASGGMAEVFRAELVSPGGIARPVVIKRVLREHAKDPAFRAMFLEEARIAGGLTHGNICQVVDAGELDGEPYIALEFIDGRSLDKILDRVKDLKRRLPPAYAALVIAEVCRGLHYAHTRQDASGRPLGLVHRDISPQNVMISFDGEVKVVDFGIARAYSDPSTRPGLVKTATGAVKGKLSYFAPEQARGERLDARSDVYATGVVLFEAICGRLPFHGNPAEVLGQIAYGQVPSPNVFVPDLPIELERVIMKALQFDPDERFQTAAQMHEALTRWLGRAGRAPGFQAVGEVLRLLFEYELRANGAPPTVSPETRAEVDGWPRSGEAAPWVAEAVTTASSPAAAEPGPTTVEGATAHVAPTGAVAAAQHVLPQESEGPWRAWLLVAVALASGVPLAVWDYSNLPSQAPASATPQKPEVEAPAGIDPGLADHLAHVKKPPAPPAPPSPPPPKAFEPLFGTQPDPRIGCEVQAMSAAATSHRAAAMEAAKHVQTAKAVSEALSAIRAEPRAGALYAELATWVIQWDIPDANAARALETFLVSCPKSAASQEAELAFEVAVGRSRPEWHLKPADSAWDLIKHCDLTTAAGLVSLGAIWPERDRAQLAPLRARLVAEQKYMSLLPKEGQEWSPAIARRMKPVPKSACAHAVYEERWKL